MVIKKYTYQSTGQMVNKLLQTAGNLDDYSLAIHVVAKYEILCALLNGIVKQSNYTIANVNINDVHIDGYFDEYILSISDGKIWCQEAKKQSEYRVVDGLITFVHSDCSSRFVTRNKHQLMVEFDFADEKER